MERYEKYDFDEFADLYNGPDAIMLTDELTKYMDITPDMKVLDLGAGNALSSLFLVKEYGCRVYAVDPRASSAENYDTAVKYEVQDKLIPFCATANNLPFEHDSFDAMICINAYQAFGMDKEYFNEKLAPFLKSGAQVGIVVPATTEEYEKEAGLDKKQVLPTFWSANKWRAFFEPILNLQVVKDMEWGVEAWKRWYRAASPIARRDPTAKWNIGKEVAIVMIVGTVKNK